ncbi:hypothetical protein NO932_06620 [Pelagibacterium sp. 26DY04]|uniref:hypothetical protein n=1 Tax=Pelagibacterium sp. 26DY04 TaxID=2967130 RepID=UPI00281620A1|nr:hypothetical protein [Pelagibacterium sp. 26DY04]WMT88279.1 hypothetical protein NO932_06620 [Pelagibacterium sp. 26DY04]
MVFPFLPVIGGALGAIGSIVGGSMQANAANRAASRNTDLANQYRDEGLGYLDAGTERAAGYLDQVGGLYEPLSELGMRGANMRANALGLNGAEGTAAAQEAFQTGPGYQFALDQGLQALERRGAAQGRLQSGQTGIDTMKYATGLADQSWNNWLGNLGSYDNMALAGAAGQGGALNNLANLYTGDAAQRVDLTGGVLQSIMGANNQRAAGQQAFGASVGNALGSLGGALGGFTGYGSF